MAIYIIDNQRIVLQRFNIHTSIITARFLVTTPQFPDDNAHMSVETLEYNSL